MTPTTVIIPYKPRYPQPEIHKALETHRFKTLVAHRRLGKSVTGINHLIKRGVQITLREPRLGFMAPFLKQGKMIAWNYLKRYAMAIPGAIKNETDLCIDLPHNKARIQIFGADNAEAVRGTYFDELWLDEFGNFKPKVYDEILRPTLVDRKGGVTFNGTPKGQNAFYEQYQMALRGMQKKDPNWWAGMYRADETNVIDAEELALVRAAVSDRVYRQEFLCDFTAEADNVLITIDLVTAAAGKVLAPDSITRAPKILGVDVARFGDDRSVIVKRQGLQMFDPIIYSKIDNMTLASRVAKVITDWDPDAVFIDAGRGEGVIDRLRQLNYEVTSVNFGGSPLDPVVHKDKRTEMWDAQREWLEEGGAIPNHPDWKSELVTPTYSFHPITNQMRLESNDTIKARSGKSPDIASAGVLTFAFPVKVRDRSLAAKIGGSGGRAEMARPKDYDPYA
ncbi:MAG TPA: terminase [Elusimicrobiota bacterium]|nr:terminase [Elusimicrobiota bacterium]